MTSFASESHPAAGSELSGRELAQRVYDRPVGEDMTSHAVMELISAKGSVRKREFQVYGMDQKGQRSQLIRFTSPADISGTGFLVFERGQGDTEQFLYLPALRRTRRIVSSQKGHSFVNSDFSYEDMERRPVDSWSHKIAGSEKIGPMVTLVLESRPKEDTTSSYTLVKSWVAPEIDMPLRVEYYQRNDRLVKTYQVLSLENIQGYWTETKVVMEDAESGHKTIIANLETSYDTGLSDDIFTQRYLESQ
ncbi:outer membrane lipoprotein-sorting protein [Geoalkalibacter subterraneus]|uniref:Uncharacterized protein TP-0789 domain-containing protein n=1 Tax=Geoalkalibacter subterraneus TaxID=483547 RepID=A0A0B5FID3_9BACT|nr:outer membrane lipoprotein-sorting protein [Geoalkalibacter subterraneus]AJF07962.1 hypothetical protein GSUB_07865 [Geoalkalibacter subterraneus]